MLLNFVLDGSTEIVVLYLKCHMAAYAAKVMYKVAQRFTINALQIGLYEYARSERKPWSTTLRV
jgi:hypothetical protein